MPRSEYNAQTRGDPMRGTHGKPGAALLLVLILSACASTPSGSPATSRSPATSIAPGASASPYQPNVDPANFSGHPIDNPFYPLVPGTQTAYEGDTDAGHERAVTEVTADTRVVMGVTCVVVHDSVTTDGQLTEDTYDWYAQDSAGNVWYFGEATQTFRDGQPVSTEGSWEGGVAGALPGIIMRAEPAVGDRYREEYLPGHAEDIGEVLSVSETATIAIGSYSNLVLISDTTPLEPDLVEHKFYARGIGLVLDTTVAGGNERSELVEK
jgi:hypothetical protein